MFKGESLHNVRVLKGVDVGQFEWSGCKKRLEPGLWGQTEKEQGWKKQVISAFVDSPGSGNGVVSWWGEESVEAGLSGEVTGSCVIGGALG